MTATAELADVVLPAAAGWAETEGTVTNSERRVQRARPAVPMPEGVRSDVDVIVEVAARLGHAWVNRTPEALWNELRQVSSMHGGMSWTSVSNGSGGCIGRARQKIIPARRPCIHGFGTDR